MFSLYGISGPVFQGTLENLGRLPPVARRRPITAARRLGEEFPLPASGRAANAAPVAQGAVDAYREMLPESLERGPIFYAHQLMQSEVIAVHADDPVAHAWRTLTGQRIHQAPVLDATQTLVGIVSERNLLTAFNVDEAGVRDVLNKHVRDVMTSPVVAATPDTELRLIVRAMLERDVDGVPICTETGRLLGFISRSDILAAVVNDPPLRVWR